MGLLAKNKVPVWHPATPAIRLACERAVAKLEARGLNLSEVAVLWVLSRHQLSTTLVSTPSKQLMQQNLSLALRGGAGLTPEEAAAVEEVETLFSFLPSTQWENMEVAAYWDNMTKLGATQK